MKQCLVHMKWRKQILKGRIKTGKYKNQLWLVNAYEGEFFYDELIYKLNAKRNRLLISFFHDKCVPAVVIIFLK
jgi:hypothetical protein